jgi:hypothetical protein
MKPNWRRRAAPQAERDRRALSGFAGTKVRTRPSITRMAFGRMGTARSRTQPAPVMRGGAASPCHRRTPIRCASRPLLSGALMVASYDWSFGLETHECSSMLS